MKNKLKTKRCYNWNNTQIVITIGGAAIVSPLDHSKVYKRFRGYEGIDARLEAMKFLEKKRNTPSK